MVSMTGGEQSKRLKFFGADGPGQSPSLNKTSRFRRRSQSAACGLALLIGSPIFKRRHLWLRVGRQDRTNPKAEFFFKKRLWSAALSINQGEVAIRFRTRLKELAEKLAEREGGGKKLN